MDTKTTYTHPTAQAILDEACQQFAEKGYHGASISSIASAVGQSKQVLLHHFGSKDHLYELVVTELTRMLQSILERVEHIQDPIQRYEALLQYSLDEEYVQAAMMIYRDLMDTNRGENTILDEFNQNWVGILSSYARELPGFENASDDDVKAFVLQTMAIVGFHNLALNSKSSRLPVRKLSALKKAYKKQVLHTINSHAKSPLA